VTPGAAQIGSRLHRAVRLLDVARLDPRRLARGHVLLPFRRVLRGARTLGIGVARGTRAGEDVSAGADSDRCRFPPFSAWQLRRNHFAAAIGLAPSGRISENLGRHRCRASPHIDPPVARGPRNGPAVPPTASSVAPTRLMRIRRAMISRCGARTQAGHVPGAREVWAVSASTPLGAVLCRSVFALIGILMRRFR